MALSDCKHILENDPSNQATKLMQDKLTPMLLKCQEVLVEKKAGSAKESKKENVPVKETTGKNDEDEESNKEMKRIKEEQRLNAIKEINKQTEDITNKALGNFYIIF